MKSMRYPIFNITAYALMLSDTFYLQGDIPASIEVESR